MVHVEYHRKILFHQLKGFFNNLGIYRLPLDSAFRSTSRRIVHLDADHLEVPINVEQMIIGALIDTPTTRVIRRAFP